jgi:hypothetical protein
MPEGTPAVQTYANHVRRLPRLYLLSCLALAINLLWTLWILWRQPSPSSGIAVLAALGMAGIAWAARTNALRVQDRVVRLEERLRLHRLLDETLRARIEELSVSQLVALRFACDAEVPELVRRVLDEKLAGREQMRELKRSIRSWRADWLRV